LFLDEIQDCPNAIMSLRYFKEQLPKLHVVGAGSLLELVLREADFRVPVGRIEMLYLRPLSFEEFLIALSKQGLLEYLESLSVDVKTPDLIHQELIELSKLYGLLGGMPAVLQTYLLTNNIMECQNTQGNLLAGYRKDFGKYATKTQYKYLQLLFDKAPLLIAQWFKYVKVDPSAQSRDIKIALELLHAAHLIQLIYASNASGIPLDSTVNLKKFKLLFLDVGLMQHACQIDAESWLSEPVLMLNRGSIAEQWVGQALLSLQGLKTEGKLHFWVREQAGSTAEIDYLVTCKNQLIPIAVKAGNTGRLTSLRVFLAEKKSPLGVRISEQPLQYRKDHRILSIPFYLIGQLTCVLSEASLE
jgi:predicted AAA+ superfamily ATPase